MEGNKGRAARSKAAFHVHARPTIEIDLTQLSNGQMALELNMVIKDDCAQSVFCSLCRKEGLSRHECPFEMRDKFFQMMLNYAIKGDEFSIQVIDDFNLAYRLVEEDCCAACKGFDRIAPHRPIVLAGCFLSP